MKISHFNCTDDARTVHQLIAIIVDQLSYLTSIDA